MISYYKTVDSCIREIDDYEVGCWVNVIKPNKDDVTFLKDKLKISYDYILYSLDDEESSRIESEDGQTFLIFDAPCADKDEDNLIYTTMPIGVIVTPENVITIALKDNQVLSDFSRGSIKNIETSHKTKFVLTMLFRMATRFLQNLKQIDKYSSSLETTLRRSMKNKELVQLLDLEKSLVYFQTSLKSNQVTIEKILRGKHLKLYEDDQDLLDDVLIELKQALEMSNIYSSILSGTMDAFASVISNNLNIVMKILTSITILLAIPTMIFSFFGMNIGVTSGIPLSQNLIFPAAITVVSTIIVGVVLYKKNMF